VAALARAQDPQSPVASFDGEVFDVGAEGFEDPQPVQRQLRDQGMVTAAGQARGDQQAPNSLRSKPTARDS
jgi:hypothetical protein